MADVGPIAYLTGEYPRATDTFIQREVAGLRANGIDVFTTSIRKTGVEHLVGEEQRAEAAQTFYILNAAKSPLRLLKCHARALRKSPGRYFRALALALRTRPPGLKAGLYQLFYFAEAAVLADHLQQNGVTHLHNHIAKASCTVAMLMSELSGIPYSFTLHGPDIFFEPHHWRLDEKIARAKFVACISHFCRSQAMAFSDPSHWSKLHIVHCGIEPGRYDDASERTGGNLLFVGRLAAVKGLPVLFDALEALHPKHPDLHVTIIGDGPDRAALEERARALSDMVDFVGYKSQAEVAETLRRMDMLVLPSFAEGVPVVLMEAMAAGIPVVTTRIAGVPELVENGVSGVLAPPGDAGALADAISGLLGDADLRAKMGRAGREMVTAEFNIAHETAWLAQILAEYQNGTQPPLRPVREG
ncbi:glycosyltransferase family 4 protein [Aliiroseovarius sp. YM-037]|uniref:glycosyltransferase family 4 protein n=1 Tax=Aliiroseovarius sp. YM-037 TaxID=3341728 RepID=UPI003A7FC26B